MATALDVLNVARSQIGFHEGANNENPYGDWYGIPSAPYCAMGLSWCFAQVGLSHLIAAQTQKGFSYNPVALHWFQMQGMVVNKMSMTTGDLVFYDWNGDGVADHVELCEAASPGGFTTIAFNTGNPNDPTQTGCWRVHRNWLFVIINDLTPFFIASQLPINVAAKRNRVPIAISGGISLTASAIAR